MLSLIILKKHERTRGNNLINNVLEAYSIKVNVGDSTATGICKRNENNYT